MAAPSGWPASDARSTAAWPNSPRLVGTRTWAVCDGFTLGDIAVGTVCGYLSVRFSDLPWRSLHPNLSDYVDRLDERPSFRATVPVPQTFKDKVV